MVLDEFLREEASEKRLHSKMLEADEVLVKVNDGQYEELGDVSSSWRQMAVYQNSKIWEREDRILNYDENRFTVETDEGNSYTIKCLTKR
jgi:hypothetical protein